MGHPLYGSTPMDLARARDVAVRAARVGGAVILEAAGPGAAGAKGLPGDWVTEVDVASERAIGAVLAEEAADVPVVAEEGGGHPADRYWLVDPLDGTTNFLRGFPVVGVSVALVAEGRPMAGCVHAPFLVETFAAARGLGSVALLEDGSSRRLSVARRPTEQAVVATGFPFRRKERLPRYVSMFEGALDRFEDLRRPGAAALDLAWTAAGVFDGFFELGLGPWDVAAGALLVEESGGRVTDWGGGPGYLGGDVLAAPPKIHEILVDLASRSEGGSMRMRGNHPNDP